MRRCWVIFFALWLAPAVTPDAAPAAKGAELLYIDNSLSDYLTVVRLPDHKVVGAVTVGLHPHGLAASGDGKRLYVSVESTSELLAVDTATDRVLWRVVVSGHPNQIALSGDGRHVYVPIRPADFVEVIDTQERRVVAKVKVGRSPHNTLACADGRHIYATSMDDNQVTIIDAGTQRAIGTIPCGGIVRPIAVTRDESRMYVALSDLHGCVVVDIPARRVVGRLFLPPPPEGVEPLVPHTPTHGLGLAPGGKLLVVTSVVGDYVGLFAVPGHEFLGRVATGKAPNWLAFRQDGKVCYVSNAGSDDVSAVDLEARREVARIKAGKQPKRLLTVVVPERPRTAPNDDSH